MQTRAIRDGVDYVVTGRKIWTTEAHFADMMFCLARTGVQAKPQQGISFLLLDMRDPGVTVRPIRTLDSGHTVNEVFVDQVRVPADNLVGQEGMGWTYAKFLLAHERSALAGASRSRAALTELRTIAMAEQQAGAPLIRDPDFSRKLAALEADLMALEFTELRILGKEAKGEKVDAESSILKVAGSEILQRVSDLAVEAVGYYALPDAAHTGGNDTIGPDYARGIAGRYFNLRKVSIYGGSNEIQRNIIAKAVLGL